jgi:hypothetical protein
MGGHKDGTKRDHSALQPRQIPGRVGLCRTENDRDSLTSSPLLEDLQAPREDVVPVTRGE